MLSIREIYDKRATNRIGLQTFVDYLNDNNFEESVSDEFNQLKNQLNQEIKDYLESQEEENNLDYYLETQFFEDKLLALTEMKIVYLYKNFEINVKRLLRASYKVKTRDFHQWARLKDFIKDKNIRLEEIDAYQEVDQLRKINNAIKHSTGKLSEDLKSISEFRDARRLAHYELDEFYERIRFSPFKFLQSLSDKIYADLYEFSDSRLEKISELLALRMDQETAIKFIEKLKTKY